MVYSPNAVVPSAARSERPISRWISWLRPPGPFRSRAVRSWVARGSMAYSAVTHPCPLPFRNGGTPSSTLAVQWTSVPPIRGGAPWRTGRQAVARQRSTSAELE
jgi:hypothetical protein